MELLEFIVQHNLDLVVYLLLLVAVAFALATRENQ